MKCGYMTHTRRHSLLWLRMRFYFGVSDNPTLDTQAQRGFVIVVAYFSRLKSKFKVLLERGQLKVWLDLVR